jgi:hypothetical protein
LVDLAGNALEVRDIGRKMLRELMSDMLADGDFGELEEVYSVSICAESYRYVRLKALATVNS